MAGLPPGLVGKRLDPAAGTYTAVETWSWARAGRGEPQIVDCAAVTALRGCRGRCAGGQARRRLATDNARRGAGAAGW